MSKKYAVKIGSTINITLARVTGENNTPVNLTDYTVQSTVHHPKLGEYELDVTLTDPVNGIVSLVLDEDTSSGILAGDYQWDVIYTKPNGDVEIFPKDHNVILSFIKGATAR